MLYHLCNIMMIQIYFPHRCSCLLFLFFFLEDTYNICYLSLTENVPQFHDFSNMTGRGVSIMLAGSPGPMSRCMFILIQYSVKLIFFYHGWHLPLHLRIGPVSESQGKECTEYLRYLLRSPLHPHVITWCLLTYPDTYESSPVALHTPQFQLQPRYH